MKDSQLSEGMARLQGIFYRMAKGIMGTVVVNWKTTLRSSQSDAEMQRLMAEMNQHAALRQIASILARIAKSVLYEKVEHNPNPHP